MLPNFCTDTIFIFSIPSYPCFILPLSYLWITGHKQRADSHFLFCAINSLFFSRLSDPIFVRTCPYLLNGVPHVGTSKVFENVILELNIYSDLSKTKCGMSNVLESAILQHSDPYHSVKRAQLW